MNAFNPMRPVHISREQALSSIPVKNSDVTELRLETGEVLLTYPVTLRPWIASLAGLFNRSAETFRTRKLQLDALGTFVWDLLNGDSTVEQIILHFSKTHRISRREAEASVTQFLRDLGRRGLIGLQ